MNQIIVLKVKTRQRKNHQLSQQTPMSLAMMKSMGLPLHL